MKLNIYLSGSISGSRSDEDIYRHHIERLKMYGTVLTETIVGTGGEKDITDTQIFAKNMAWLKKADVLVAEVTQSSLGVGYEIGLAVGMKKKILCLYRHEVRKLLSPMISGSHNGDSFIVKYYRENEADEIFNTTFNKWFSEDSTTVSRESSVLEKPMNSLTLAKEK